LEIGFIDHFNTRNSVTARNYCAIDNLHTLQITTAHAKASHSAFICRFPVTASNGGDSSASALTPLPAGHRLTNELNSKSKLLCEWRFTADQFALASSPLRFTARDFFFQRNSCGHSLYVTSSMITPWHGPRRKYRLQQFLYCCAELFAMGLCLFCGHYLVTIYVRVEIHRQNAGQNKNNLVSRSK
jgi:hypothetical protein